MPAQPYTPLSDTDFDTAFPNSRRVLVEGGQGVHAPMREITLSDGAPALRVYDTSGPRIADLQAGLPPLRADWIRGRGDVEETGRGVRAPILRARAGRAVTQLHYARRGE